MPSARETAVGTARQAIAEANARFMDYSVAATHGESRRSTRRTPCSCLLAPLRPGTREYPHFRQTMLSAGIKNIELEHM